MRGGVGGEGGAVPALDPPEDDAPHLAGVAKEGLGKARHVLGPSQ